MTNNGTLKLQLFLQVFRLQKHFRELAGFKSVIYKHSKLRSFDYYQ
jgi:hypothetical protein